MILHKSFLALKHGKLLTEVWNVKYHQFFGGFLFEWCKPKPKAKGTSNLNCCGKYPVRSPFDMNNKVCCDGYITDENRCVSSSFNKRKRRGISLSEMFRNENEKSNEKPIEKVLHFSFDRITINLNQRKRDAMRGITMFNQF